MTKLSILTQTDLKNRRASDPNASAFVSANAGSGKTYVLVRRILRLLVDGVDPSKILALTYTTAAAANMSNRVFLELSKWVRLDDEALSREIESLDGIVPNAARLTLARQIFARAIETPGGLKIQTIHAFCERVLHLFPFEANVPAGFDVLDDDASRSILEMARNAVINFHTRHRNPDLIRALQIVASETGEAKFDETIQKVLRFQHDIRINLADDSALDDMVKRLARHIGVDAHETGSSIDELIYQNRLTDQVCRSCAEYLAQSDKKTDISIAQALIDSLAFQAGHDWQNVYLPIFFTQEEVKKADKSLGTKYVQDNRPDVFDLLLRERDRLDDLLDRKRSILAIERTRALIVVARAIIDTYDTEKARRGALDFGDLVERTGELLKRTSAQWVLYKLDKGIDHLLIDEAQDTSPEQWDVLERLTDEFYSGFGARPLTRTIFAVGDPKQSIYSFQGADPKKFSEYRDRFAQRITQLPEHFDNRIHTFHREELTLSFRSTPDILNAVDSIFSFEHHYTGLERDPQPTQHQSVRMDATGLVELWPVIRKDKIEISENWLKPVDRPDNNAPSVELACRIASHIAKLIAPNSRERLEDKPGQYRSIVPGDILILVRKRGILFETIIRALKDLGLPVAGADRLKLASHIAVMDLVALGESILTPDDDLKLATVLKSPIIGLNDDDLFTLCYERSGSLYSTLMRKQLRTHLAAAQDAYSRFKDAAQRFGPYGFYAFVLGPCGARAQLRARLGHEAEDAIDEFLRLALEHDHHETCSLSEFLSGFQTAEREVKRDMESGRNEIRVMTVHGAKGLEAPIVYLPDTTGSAKGKGIDPIFDLDDTVSTLLWARTQKEDSKVIAEWRDRMTERVRHEHRRLLYVALTRARDRLYIGGFAGSDKLPDDCWYGMIEHGLQSQLHDTMDLTDTPVRRMQSKPYPAISEGQPHDAIAPVFDLPAWLGQTAPIEAQIQPPLRPSSALDAADRSDRQVDFEFASMARRRGTLIHSMLEFLPDIEDVRRNDVARVWLIARAADLAENERDALVQDALQLIQDERLSALFRATSRAEVPIAGILKREGRAPRPVSGQIDRLAVTDDDVIIADYKTAARLPETIDDIPIAYIAQLATYRALLSALYSEKHVRCMLIYTAGPRIFEIDADRLEASLAQIA